MLDPKLLINGVPISVGQSIHGLKAAGFKKNGFFLRWRLLPANRRLGTPCDAGYSVMDPRIELFGDPDAARLDPKPDLTEEGGFWSTCAQVFSDKGIITGVDLMFLRSSIQGRILKQAVRSSASQAFGPGMRSPTKDMPRLKGDRVRQPGFEHMLWSDNDSYMVFQGVTAGRSCYLSWVGRSVPEQVARMCPVPLESNEIGAATPARSWATQYPSATTPGLPPHRSAPTNTRPTS